MAGLLLHPAVILAATFGAVATLLLGTLGVAAGLRLRVQLVALSFATLFFLGLTQLPLPDPALLKTRCPLIGAQPNWLPFYTVDQVYQEWRAYLLHPHMLPLHVLSLGPGTVEGRLTQQGWQTVLREGWTLPAGLNFLVCLPIGALLFPYVRRVRAVVGAGFALSLAVELTQLTGTWGFYPCAYRKFDMDDLVLNTLGVALGFALARRLAAPGGARSRSRSL
jgi:hypothetical protein